VAPPAATPPPAPAAAPPLAPLPSYLGLAARLQQEGQYDSCTVEALRDGYVHPDEAAVADERAALCLDLAGRYEDARRTLLQLEGAAALDAHSRFRLCYSEVFLSDGPTSELCTPPGGRAASREAAIYLLMASYTKVMKAMLDRRYADGARELAQWPQVPPGTLANWEAQDHRILDRSGHLSHRSPWLAALLSVVLPGAGRAYIGRWGDGAFSLILVGAPAGFAAYEFSRSGVSSVGGWILASLGGLFYLGDVYGSAIGAVIYNRQQADNLAAQVKEAYVGRADP
jgi:TM2 domain-containing membrane protein YozV